MSGRGMSGSGPIQRMQLRMGSESVIHRSDFIELETVSSVLMLLVPSVDMIRPAKFPPKQSHTKI